MKSMNTAKNMTNALQRVPTSQGRSGKINLSLLVVLGALLVVAAIWSYMLVNASTHKTLDQRVYDVASQLKCPICQGESVADSPAVLAQEMRSVIRQQLQSGRSEQQVIQYFIASYGQQIVWSPPWQGFSLIAWLAPIGLVLGGMVLLFFIFRDWRKAAPVRATQVEETALVEGDEEEEELAQYRKQLAEELAADDPLFNHYTREVR